jgi:hypothetical protein
MGNGTSSALKAFTAVVLIIIAASALICTYTYVSTQKHLKESTENYIEDNTREYYSQMESIDDAMSVWQDEKEYDRCKTIYYQLPAEIVRALYEDVGLNAFIQEYVHQYELNKEHYLSLIVAKQFERIGVKDLGIDGSLVKNIAVTAVLDSDLIKPDSVMSNVKVQPAK